jgi:hypothetical protein
MAEEASHKKKSGKLTSPRSSNGDADANADADWRGTLWQGWREELSRMDKDKASLLKPKVRRAHHNPFSPLLSFRVEGSRILRCVAPAVVSVGRGKREEEEEEKEERSFIG